MAYPSLVEKKVGVSVTGVEPSARGVAPGSADEPA